MSDELKTIWGQLNDEADTALIDETKLKAMIAKKSNSILESLKGSLRKRFWVQVFFAIVLIGMAIYFKITAPQKIQGVWLLLLFFTCFVIMTVNKGVAIMKINQFQGSVYPLKTSINHAIVLLRQVWLLEGSVETFFISICLSLMLFKRIRPAEWFENLTSDQKIVFMVIASCVIMLLMYLAFRSIQNRRYGCYEKGLKECLGELEG